MDNVTHALAGALIAAAASQLQQRSRPGPLAPTSPHSPVVPGDSSASPEHAPSTDAAAIALGESFRRAVWPLAIIMAELPDADLVYARSSSLGAGNLSYLLHHRGHTHTVVVGVVAALLAWGVTLLWKRDLRGSSASRSLLIVSLVATLSHILLDWTNSYGVHPFWPFDNRWYYGDAIFIVEPWLWIVAIPPIVFTVRRVAWRVLVGALMVVILAAAWRTDMVSRDVAAVLTGTALAWTLGTRLLPAAARVPMALAAWLAVEVTFFAAAGAAREIVRHATGSAYRDVVLTPSPGNPLCWLATVVTLDGGTYASTQATVAPFPAQRAVTACRNEDDRIPGAPGGREDTREIHWGVRWTAPVQHLRALAATNCEAAAALRFMRTPAWQRRDDGDIALFDVRYGGDGGFASIRAHPGAPCPRAVPAWIPPRQDLLETAPSRLTATSGAIADR